MNVVSHLNDIFDKSERLRNKRFKIKTTLINELYIKLGLDSIDKGIFENFSNTLLRRMVEELK